MFLNLHNHFICAFVNPPHDIAEHITKNIGYFFVDHPEKIDVTYLFVDGLEWNKIDPDIIIGTGAFKKGDMFFIKDHNWNIAELPLEQIGRDNLTIRVGSRFNPHSFFNLIFLPVLKSYLNKKGLTLIHASGVVYNERGYIFPAWEGTGKTNILLELLRKGASYLGDEILIIDKNGYAYPFYQFIGLNSHNLEVFKNLKKYIGMYQRFLLVVKKVMIAFVKLMPIAIRDNLMVFIRRYGLIKIPFSEVTGKTKLPEKVRIDKVIILFAGKGNTLVNKVDHFSAIYSAANTLWEGFERYARMYDCCNNRGGEMVYKFYQDREIIREFIKNVNCSARVIDQKQGISMDVIGDVIDTVLKG